MINKTFNYHQKIIAYGLILVPCMAIILSVFMCNQAAHEEAQLNNSIAEPLSLIKKKPIITSDVPMAGDTAYIPIRWGSQLRVVPNVIYKGKHPKFGNYWFCKSMAYSRVDPANYMQDSIRERVAFADSALITNSDTFYICRRKIY